MDKVLSKAVNVSKAKGRTKLGAGCFVPGRAEGE